jgi:hypothetical protein
MPEKLSPAEIQTKLAAIQSGEFYYKHWLGMHYTEGVKYMAELCNAFWLIDAIASHQPNPKVRSEEFQVWFLKSLGDHWLLTCEDGNGHSVVQQVITYSDFPLQEIEIWVEDGVVLMPKEH